MSSNDASPEADPTVDADPGSEVPGRPVRLIEPADVPVEDPDTADPAEPPVGSAADPAAEPTVDPTTAPAVWRPADRSTVLAFNLARIPGAGEDADPIVRDGQTLGRLGVFDGMGGAGGTVYTTPEGRFTGAYLASRVARSVVDEYLALVLPAADAPDGEALAAELHDRISTALRDTLAGLHAPPSGLRSTLLRALPTTMALTVLRRPDPEVPRWSATVLWVGDSRIYTLDAPDGLRQLTRDDIRGDADALSNLRQDSVLTNAISADTEFVVHCRTLELVEPFLLIGATDGCFGYLPTPMHFENLLLRTLAEAADPEAWSSDLQTAVAAVSGDDAALAVLAPGSDFAELKALLADRTRLVRERWTAPLDGIAAEIARLEARTAELREQWEQSTADMWNDYRTGYESVFAAAPDTEDR